ncbi:AGE family epimerase/isomerase [Balneatrix alpica]|uniref:AGE family epimerase/isomerase n=1 Tax=Balneatrix alpica TaxID=75684 RepID=A0ABV5ZDT7_9GAMM|nr:AGE family epimerase/isomerase [Balneatrix alpica]
MDFHNPQRLREHVRAIMAFYHPRAIDSRGGFYHYFLDDGQVYDSEHRHLVSSTRYVFTYANFARHFNEPEYLRWAEHGLDFIEQRHFQTQYQGYAWTLQGNAVEDDTNHCYGLAFVMLAYATALKAGIERAREGLYRVHELQSRRFWQAQHGLYADEADRHWQLGQYRGQNANMHSCEALIAAYEATGDRQFIERALQVADNICRRQAGRCDHGLIWEHYDLNWQPDWQYNLDDPKHLFRPWGYQPGHQTEWAKLLLLLEPHVEADWLLPTAEHLFLRAVEPAWDKVNGGLAYGLDRQLQICDGDKYHWVQAETLAAAALLGSRTGDLRYWRWYERIWDYCWQHFIDHRYGAWYRILTPDNQPYSKQKSPAGKVDYHTMGACYDMLRVLE